MVHCNTQLKKYYKKNFVKKGLLCLSPNTGEGKIQHCTEDIYMDYRDKIINHKWNLEKMILRWCLRKLLTGQRNEHKEGYMLFYKNYIEAKMAIWVWVWQHHSVSIA